MNVQLLQTRNTDNAPYQPEGLMGGILGAVTTKSR